MKPVTMYKTHDGKLHETIEKAEHQLDVEYGSILCALVREILMLNYYKATEYIDANLGKFAELAKIKADMKLEKEEE